jgi:hypothetical protein
MWVQKVTIGRVALALRGPAWLGGDARIVVLARALRTFGYGCTSILLAGMLSEDGVSAPGIGLLLGVAALGSVTASIVMGVFADRFGRRRSLLVTATPDTPLFHTRRITHRDDLVVVENLISYDGQPWTFTVNVMEFRDDRVAHERIDIMDGREAAVWREPWRSATRADPPFPEP